MLIKRLITGTLAAAIALTSIGFATFAERPTAVPTQASEVSVKPAQKRDDRGDTLGVSKPERRKYSTVGQVWGDFEYGTLYFEGTITIMGYTGLAENLKIPSEIEGIKVTGISSDAFRNCDTLVTVQVPNGVTFIDDSAFQNCSSLKSINIPDSVVWIGRYAFSDTPLLDNQKGNYKYVGKWLIYAEPEMEEITDEDGFVFEEFCRVDKGDIKAGTVGIADYVFFVNKELVSVVLPDTIKSIGTCAFDNCASLETINIPDSVTHIGMEAFRSCKSLKSFTIPDKATWIGRDFLDECYSLETINVGKNNPEYKSVDGVLYDKPCKFLFLCPGAKKGACNIPAAVEYIEEDAFLYCHQLTDINVNKSNKLFKSYNGVLLDKSGETLIKCPNAKEGEYAIPSTVKTLSDSAFEGCRKLTSIKIPNSVTKLGWHTFSGCSSIKSITIPSSITSLTGGLFSGCSSLQTVKLPSGLTKICDFAFSECKSLSSINIPDGVKSVGYGAFFGCYALKKIVIPQSITEIDDYAFGYYVGWKDNGYGYKFKISGVKLYCFKNSAGEQYAKKNQFDYKIITKDTPREVVGFKMGGRTDTSITLKWKKSTDATGYIIHQWKNDRWVRIAKIENNSTVSYKVTGLKPATRYGFRIQAYKNIKGGAEKSDFTDKVVILTRPKAVSGFKASGKTNSSVTLKWTQNTAVTGYIIEQYKGNKWIEVAKINGNSVTSYNVTGLSASTRYAFRICSYKFSGSEEAKSAYTNKLVVYTNPNAVTGFRVYGKTSNSIALVWNKNSSVTGYIIEQYKGNKWVRIAKIDKNSTASYRVTGLKANTRYAFRIQGYKNIPGSAVRTAFTDKLVVYTYD